MNSQRGAALVAVMSILTVALMLGITGMQSSAINERLAGNYQSASNAQMIAESGAAYGMEMLGTPGYFDEHDSGEACEDFAEPGLSEQGRRSVDGDIEWYEVDGIDAEIIGCRDDDLGLDLYLSWGQVRDGGGAIISESFVVFGDGGGDGDVLTINGSPPLSNPLVCLRSAGDGCGWEDSGVADFFDGRPHPVPVDFDCNGAGCRTSPEGSDATDVVYDEALWSVWNDYVESLISGFDPEEYNDFSRGERDEVEVIIVEGDVKHAANINTYGIIVVKGGSSLELSGTGHHEGLIIVKDGGVLRMRNNTNVYGAVVALGEITLEGWGNNPPRAGVRYSAISSGETGRPGDFVWQIL